MERVNRTRYYLDIANKVAERSTCIRYKFGAIIVKDDRIISTGYNGSPRGAINCSDVGKCPRIEQNIPSGSRYETCHSVHAEANAIINASPIEREGATLYLSMIDPGGNYNRKIEPCMMCERLIINGGIKTIVCGDIDSYEIYHVSSNHKHEDIIEHDEMPEYFNSVLEPSSMNDNIEVNTKLMEFNTSNRNKRIYPITDNKFSKDYMMELLLDDENIVECLTESDILKCCNSGGVASNITVNGITFKKNQVKSVYFGNLWDLDYIPNYFCYYFSNLTHLDPLPDFITTIGARFMYNCTSFNQPLTLPSSLTSIGDYFMYNCNNFISPLEILFTDPNVFSIHNYSLSTNSNSVPMYTTGVTITGNMSGSQLQTVLPDLHAQPYYHDYQFRKIIDYKKSDIDKELSLIIGEFIQLLYRKEGLMIINDDNAEVIFEGRVEELSLNEDECHHYLYSAKIIFMEVSSDRKIIVYI